MMHISQSDQTWDQGPVAIRALRSLRENVVEAVRETVLEMASPWSLECHDDYDGYLSVLVSHERDPNAPSFLISGKVGQIEMATLHDDELRTLGRFNDLGDAIAELVSQLSLSSAR